VFLPRQGFPQVRRPFVAELAGVPFLQPLMINDRNRFLSNAVMHSAFAKCTPQDIKRFDRLTLRLADITGADAPFAATARACLRANSLDFLIKAPEEAFAA